MNDDDDGEQVLNLSGATASVLLAVETSYAEAPNEPVKVLLDQAPKAHGVKPSPMA